MKNTIRFYDSDGSVAEYYRDDLCPDCSTPQLIVDYDTFEILRYGHDVMCPSKPDNCKLIALEPEQEEIMA